MTGRTPQQIGRANRRAGYDFQLACAAWLRDNGYPHAEYVNRNGSGDIAGTGDVSVETTQTAWGKIWIKLGQSTRDAIARNLPIPVVWKKKNGKSDPAEGIILISPRLFWPMMLELDAYRRNEMDAQLQFERGYELGRRERGTA